MTPLARACSSGAYADGRADRSRSRAAAGARQTPDRWQDLSPPRPRGRDVPASTSVDPAVGRYFKTASELCHVVTKRDETREPGQTRHAETASEQPGEPGELHLRAPDTASGRPARERKLGKSIRTNSSEVAFTADRLAFFSENAGTSSAGRIADGALASSTDLNARVRVSHAGHQVVRGHCRRGSDSSGRTPALTTARRPSSVTALRSELLGADVGGYAARR